MENNTSGISLGIRTPTNRSRINRSKIFPYLLTFAIGVACGIFITQQKPTWFGLSPSAAAVQKEADETVTKVGKIIALPTDEKPTVATVTDYSKVKDQVFFQNAKNDDVVLIYSKAQKAILYRPSENKIVEVGAVNIDSSAVQTLDLGSTPSPIPSEITNL